MRVRMQKKIYLCHRDICDWTWVKKDREYENWKEKQERRGPSYNRFLHAIRGLLSFYLFLLFDCTSTYIHEVEKGGSIWMYAELSAKEKEGFNESRVGFVYRIPQSYRSSRWNWPTFYGSWCTLSREFANLELKNWSASKKYLISYERDERKHGSIWLSRRWGQKSEREIE